MFTSGQRVEVCVDGEWRPGKVEEPQEDGSGYILASIDGESEIVFVEDVRFSKTQGIAAALPVVATTTNPAGAVAGLDSLDLDGLILAFLAGGEMSAKKAVAERMNDSSESWEEVAKSLPNIFDELRQCLQSILADDQQMVLWKPCIQLAGKLGDIVALLKECEVLVPLPLPPPRSVQLSAEIAAEIAAGIAGSKHNAFLSGGEPFLPQSCSIFVLAYTYASSQQGAASLLSVMA
jgi:hypothetical protein